MKLSTFQRKLQKISKKGYVKTQRAGNTGVGQTLEQLLGLRENNISIPDLGGSVELKAQRKNATNRITLFTKSPYWVVHPVEIISSYGYINGNGRMALKVTLSRKKPISGLRLAFNTKQRRIEVVDKDLQVLAFWSLDELVRLFEMKIPELIVVKAQARNSGRGEEFLYDEAYLLSVASLEGFLGALQNEDMVIELRMHLKNQGSVRDHGTAFRMAEIKLDRLFKKRVQLL